MTRERTGKMLRLNWQSMCDKWESAKINWKFFVLEQSSNQFNGTLVGSQVFPLQII